jgi:hypothetical protein
MDAGLRRLHDGLPQRHRRNFVPLQYEADAAAIAIGCVLGFELAATLFAAWLGAFAAMPYLVPPPAVERL